MIIEITCAVALWAATVGSIVAPKNIFKDTLDRKIFKGSKTEDKYSLNMIINHIENNVTDWSFSTNEAHYPKEGSKQFSIFVNKDRVEYYMSGFDKSSISKNSYYGQQLSSIIVSRNEVLRMEAVVRKLYPELADGPLMIGYSR